MKPDAILLSIVSVDDRLVVEGDGSRLAVEHDLVGDLSLVPEVPARLGEGILDHLYRGLDRIAGPEPMLIELRQDGEEYVVLVEAVHSRGAQGKQGPAHVEIAHGAPTHHQLI